MLHMLTGSGEEYKKELEIRGNNETQETEDVEVDTDSIPGVGFSSDGYDELENIEGKWIVHYSKGMEIISKKIKTPNDFFDFYKEIPYLNRKKCFSASLFRIDRIPVWENGRGRLITKVFTQKEQEDVVFSTISMLCLGECFGYIGNCIEGLRCSGNKGNTEIWYNVYTTHGEVDGINRIIRDECGANLIELVVSKNDF
eukprot:GHVP01000122.1.p1 GENE.GHVP01000122.1~~GHVP01000122.1.p1  ORF type:complete len:199 (+),score=39.42 GHVP01000122.1:156-752(+)